VLILDINNSTLVQLVQDLVDHSLLNFTRDTIGKRDFALYSVGARIIPDLTSASVNDSSATLAEQADGAITYREPSRVHPPVTILHPDLTPNRCWKFKGATGHIGIKLSSVVAIKEITIDHVPIELSHSVDDAPQDMELWEHLRAVCECISYLIRK
jgi:SUN domain-containing protein 1/2